MKPIMINNKRTCGNILEVDGLPNAILCELPPDHNPPCKAVVTIEWKDKGE